MSEKGEPQEKRINVENPLHYVQSRGFSCTPSHETLILLANVEFKRMAKTNIKHLLLARITS